MADELTPLVIPDDLSALDDAELGAAIEECLERSEALTSDEALEGLSSEDAVELMENAIATGEALDAEKKRRDEAAAEAQQILEDTRARLAQRLAGDEVTEDADEADEEPTTEPTATEDEAEEDEEPAETKIVEPVTAAARRPAKLRRSKEHEPTSGVPKGISAMALADLPGKFSAGDNISLKQAAQLIAERWQRTHAVDGPRQDVPLVRFAIETPEERTLLFGDEIGNMEKINDVVGPEALVASGGFCAPSTPLYDLQLLSTEATPVVDSMPRFGADRGGIKFMRPATLASVTTGVGQITAANDKLGGTNATKTCQVIPCPAQVEVLVDAIYHCLSFGNMGARAFPELITHFTGLTMAAHARIRETKALDALNTGTQVTAPQFGGAVNSLLPEISVAADAMRNRHRMSPTAILHAWLPEWTIGLLATDLIRQQFNRLDVLESASTRQFVIDHLRKFNVEPTFYIDSPTAGGQVFAAQTAAPLINYPSSLKWFLAPEGTWIRLDMGTLDLGIVRDSVLNATNDFQMFGEVFENYANVGVESLAITSVVCANGEVTLPKVQGCGS